MLKQPASKPLLLALSLGLAGCAAHQADLAPIDYIDAHSHVPTSITTDEEMIRLRQAGVKKVVIMNPDPAILATLTARNSGFVVPFVSVARTDQMTGLHVDAETAPAFERLYAAGAVCGFGELPTRFEPNPWPSDAASLTNDFRTAIYRVAVARGVPVNMHISLDTPGTIAAVEAIAREYPDMPIILAHSGWSASAELIGRLMAAHPNIHADLSVRLDPAGGLGGGSANISILQPDGSLLPEWRAVIERFPDRFLFGLDITAAERPRHIEQLVASARTALGGLPRGVHAAVAHGNIERLLKGCTLQPANAP